eukprot:3904704-Amphidinium_carterae.1
MTFFFGNSLFFSAFLFPERLSRASGPPSQELTRVRSLLLEAKPCGCKQRVLITLCLVHAVQS